MKRTYTKPEVCVVRYSTSDMFCQCSPDNTETVKQQLELFGWDINKCFGTAEEKCGQYQVDGYCKFTAVGDGMKVFMS